MNNFFVILVLLIFGWLLIGLPIIVTYDCNKERELYINDKFICNGTFNGSVFFCDDKRNYHDLNNYYIIDK
jgi:hypothetical protein